MAAPAPFGSQFLVNVATSGGEDSPSVAALANGDFVVAWEDNAAGTNDGKYRVYHADGTPLTGELPLNTSLAGNQGRPVVAALTDGRFAVAWRDDASGSFDIKAHVYNGDGTSAGKEFLVNNVHTADDQEEPAIAALTGGGFVVSWTSFVIGDDDIYARAFNAAGTALGDEFNVANNPQNETQSSVTGLANGNYVIAWTDGSSVIGDASGSHIEASILSGNGTAAGPTNFLVDNTITTGDQTDPSIAGVIDGSFVVAWTTPGGGGSNVEGKSYSDAGVGGSELGFADAPGSDQSQVALVAANGQFFFSWTDSSAVSGDGSGTHIGAVDTSSFSVQFLANRAFVNGNQFESSIAALADGRFLVVWTDGGLSPGAPDTAPNAVYGQIFDPRLKAVSLVGLGPLNDDWIGTRFNDAMNGAAGNDRINGAAGNDTLVGGLGTDVLTGGAGNDLFVFNTAFKPAANIDMITDYAVPDDTIELENALFTKLKKVGVLKDKFFEIGKKADDGNDYLVYNKKTGVLSYDKDGDGHKHGIAIAQLADHLQLTGSDFLVI